MRKVLVFKITSILILTLLVSGFSEITRASASEIPGLENQEQEEMFQLLEDISVDLEEEYPSEEALTVEEKIELAKIITEEVKEIEEQTEQEIEDIMTEAEQIKDFKFSLKPALQPSYAVSAASTNYNNSYTVAKLYQTNLNKANSIKANYNNLVKSNGVVFANAYRLATFYTLVKTNGAWDLKQTLGKTTKYLFKGTNKTGEYIGNHHYGYMGKAIGFANTVLKSAAGMYQIKSETSDWKFISSYFDDPADQAAITTGYTDYNNGLRFSYLIA
ncbi:polymorphic toxin type 44 domain-containing protein [Metabacillus litoralis]|uniref:polymorphic toxin type 44 domain-containing protein n=1 Tax=Metabacillus litoralis TaxID=152268 RepID=UPI001CFF4873|nr:polymorphic toxin type 44 domain-containing protein [Metabacillus litoralis]